MIDQPSPLAGLFSAAKKLSLSAFVIAAYAVFVLQQHRADSTAADSSGLSGATAQPGVTQTTASAVILPTATAVSTGRYKDGQYTGPIEDAYWGEVQVQVTVQDGNVTDVQFLDYPHDRRTSVRINRVAVPYLRTEAIQAQTARVQIISGATLTSEAFIQSLSSALKAAH